mmetsp:Transcript_119538/g.178582  ORF Transcript_119538/g.178582 Transcript_119538/m.178582 type:complete len:369 (-) Transcript_119538:1321-2427(-)
MHQVDGERRGPDVLDCALVLLEALQRPHLELHLRVCARLQRRMRDPQHRGARDVREPAVVEQVRRALARRAAADRDPRAHVGLDVHAAGEALRVRGRVRLLVHGLEDGRRLALRVAHQVRPACAPAHQLPVVHLERARVLQLLGRVPVPQPALHLQHQPLQRPELQPLQQWQARLGVAHDQVRLRGVEIPGVAHRTQQRHVEHPLLVRALLAAVGAVPLRVQSRQHARALVRRAVVLHAVALRRGRDARREHGLRRRVDVEGRERVAVAEPRDHALLARRRNLHRSGGRRERELAEPAFHRALGHRRWRAAVARRRAGMSDQARLRLLLEQRRLVALHLPEREEVVVPQVRVRLGRGERLRVVGRRSI